MVIVVGQRKTQTVRCIVCRRMVRMHEVTAGSWYTAGRQAFACDWHISNTPVWIVGWADFIVSGRGRSCRHKSLWP